MTWEGVGYDVGRGGSDVGRGGNDVGRVWE